MNAETPAGARKLAARFFGIFVHAAPVRRMENMQKHALRRGTRAFIMTLPAKGRESVQKEIEK